MWKLKTYSSDSTSNLSIKLIEFSSSSKIECFCINVYKIYIFSNANINFLIKNILSELMSSVFQFGFGIFGISNETGKYLLMFVHDWCLENSAQLNNQSKSFWPLWNFRTIAMISLLQNTLQAANGNWWLLWYSSV